MRAQFNTFCDVFYGPSSPFGPPNALYLAAVPCRLVPQLRVFQDQFPFDLTGFWLTHNAPSFNGPATSSPWVPATFDDYNTADRLDVSGFTGGRLIVCRQEFINPFGRPSYWRNLCLPVSKLVVPPWLPPQPLPPPPPPPAGCALPGTNCVTAGAMSQGVTCPYVIAAGAQQWFAWTATTPGLNFMQSNQVTGSCQYDWYYQPACPVGPLVASWVGTNTMPYFSGVPGNTLIVRVTGIASASSYSVRLN